MAQTHLPPNWRQRVLGMVNAHGWLQGQFYPEGMRFLAAWAQAEGGVARWNPLNTTYHLYGSTTLPNNTAGVQEYLRPVDGCCATAITLANGFYNGILGDLQNGTKTAEQITIDRADQIKIWGTNPDKILESLGSIPAAAP